MKVVLRILDGLDALECVEGSLIDRMKGSSEARGASGQHGGCT